MIPRSLKAIPLALSLSIASMGLTGAEDSLQTSLNDSGLDSRWIYDDWEEARTVALREKKPILAQFR